MRLRFQCDASGSEDGVSIRRFTAGDVFDVGRELAEVCLREGWAVEANMPVPPADPLPEPPTPVAPKRRAVAAPKRRKTPAKPRGSKR